MILYAQVLVLFCTVYVHANPAPALITSNYGIWPLTSTRRNEINDRANLDPQQYIYREIPYGNDGLYMPRRTDYGVVTSQPRDSSGNSTPKASQTGFQSFIIVIKTLIANMKQQQLAYLLNSTHFSKEIDQYLVKLPNNATNEVTKRTRASCYCDGQIIAPCPYKCFYSCYANPTGLFESGWGHIEDCRKLQTNDRWNPNEEGHCKCDQDSSTHCGENMKNCIQTTTEQVRGEGNCTKFFVAKPRLVEAYESILVLLVEPIKVQFRWIESRIEFLKQAADSIDDLSTIIEEICQNQDDQMCAVDAPDVLATEKDKYHQMKKNITYDLIQTQLQIGAVFKKVGNLREQTIEQLNGFIRDYTCCLKTLNFSRDCIISSSEKPIKISAVLPKFDSICPPDVSFLCGNRKCIPRSAMCNKIDNCGDNTDEDICEETSTTDPETGSYAD